MQPMLLTLLLLLICWATITHQIPADFGRIYKFNVSDSSVKLFTFTLSDKNATQAVRVTVISESANEDFPIMVVAKQQRQVVSWQLPMYYAGDGGRYPYFIVSRTLCPLPEAGVSEHKISVEISTQNPNNSAMSLNASVQEDFNLALGETRNLRVSPSQPQYRRFELPPGLFSMRVRITSDNDICMRVSLQSLECPVYDLTRSSDAAGSRQTASRKASLTVSRNDSMLGSLSSFYVVLVVYPTERHCTPDSASQLVPPDPDKPGHELYHRVKLVSITVLPALSVHQYFLPVFGAIGFFLLFFILAFIASLVHHVYSVSAARSLQQQQQQQLANTFSNSSSSSASQQQLAEPEQPARRRPSSTEDEFEDLGAEVEQDKDIFRLRSDLTVSDLSRKRPSRLSKKYKLYYWYLIIISIFYCLPVVQLVLTYQKVLNSSGDEDMCFYNFDCMLSLGLISSFNNLFSNIGYVLLGLLFLIICRRRDLLHQISQERDPRCQEFGIPQHFGLFYAMGIGMIMEGVMSGCYHVCPSYNNFQFDTAFMYMLAGLCMLKLYQTRHPDVNASAHIAYMAMAIIILVGLLGVFYSRDSLVFYLLFSCAIVLSSAVLTLEVYYIGRWSANVGRVKQMYLLLLTDGLSCFRPQRPDRLALLLIANFANWGFAVFGILNRPADFGTFLLSILMANMLMYFVFYVIMKLRHGESYAMVPVVFTLLVIAAWAAAGYFFLQTPTNWELSAAASRVHNKPCILAGFYDVHDIWHFLSAIAIFCSFMLILTIDDDLHLRRRDSIRVF